MTTLNLHVNVFDNNDKNISLIYTKNTPSDVLRNLKGNFTNKLI